MRCGGPIGILFPGKNYPTFNEILYKLGVFLFNGFYSLIDLIYKIFYTVATAKIFKDDTFEKFNNTVFSILGIVMLFIVTFSLFKMLFDPNNTKGVASGKKLFTDVVTTVFMLVLVTTIFTISREIQSDIIAQDYIGKIFFPPEEGQEEGTKAGTILAGRQMANTLLETFYLPKELSSNDDDKLLLFEPKEGASYSLTFQQVYDKALTDKDGPIFLYDLSCDGIDNQVNFQWLFAIIFAGFVCWALAIYSFDMALRVAKLAFYQLIAPIPISFRILPKKKDVFEKWLKVTLSTYLEVFIRLIFISFVIYMVQIVAEIDFRSSEMWDSSAGNIDLFVKNLAKAMIILGLINFLFSIKKIFEDIFGKGNGLDLGLGTGRIKNQLSDAKKLYTGTKNAAKGVKNFATNPIATAAAAVNQFRNNLATSRKNGSGTAASAASAVAGAAAAAYQANRNYAHGQRFSQAVANATATASTNRDDRDKRQSAINDLANREAQLRGRPDANFGDIMRARTKSRFGVDKDLADLDKTTKNVKDLAAAANNIKGLVDSTPGVAQLQSSVAQLEATKAATQSQTAEAQKNLENSNRKVTSAEAEHMKAEKRLADGKKALDDKSFDAKTREVDANGNAVEKTRNFTTPEEAEQYIANERAKSIEANERSEGIKRQAESAKKARAGQLSKVSDLEAQLNNKNSEIASAGTMQEKQAKMAEANAIASELVAAKGELSRIDELINDKEASAKKEENVGLMHRSNANNAQYALEHKDQIISERNAILTSAASGVGVKFRETKVDSNGPVSQERIITGIAAAQNYVSEQTAQYEASRAKMDNVSKEIADIKGSNSQLESEISQINGSINNYSGEEKERLIADRNAKSEQLKTNNALLASKQSEYLQSAAESEVSWNNVSSANQAVTSILQKRAVGDLTPIGYTVKSIENGNLVSQTISGVGANDAHNQMVNEESRIATLSGDLNRNRQEYASAVVKKQESSQRVAELAPIVKSFDEQIKSLEMAPDYPEKAGKLTDLRSQRRTADSQLESAKSQVQKADEIIVEKQANIQTISSDIDVHRGNVKTISNSLNDLYKENSIGTGSATITYTDTSIDNTGNVVQTQKQISGISTAKQIINETTVQRDQAKTELQNVQSTKANLIQEQVDRDNTISGYNTQLQNIDQEIIAARQDPARQADVAVLSSQYGEIKAKLDLEKSIYDRISGDVLTLNEKESKLTFAVDTSNEKISSLQSSITRAVDDPNNHGDINVLTREVQVASEMVTAAKQEKAASERIIEKHKGLEEQLNQQKTRLNTMYDTIIENNETVIVPELETVNKKAKIISQDRPDLVAELRDTYGIDISSGEIGAKDVIVKKTVKKVDKYGNERFVEASIIDWINEASTKLSKEKKTLDAVTKKEKPTPEKSTDKKEKKDDKKDGGK